MSAKHRKDGQGGRSDVTFVRDTSSVSDCNAATSRNVNLSSDACSAFLKFACGRRESNGTRSISFATCDRVAAMVIKLCSELESCVWLGRSCIGEDETEGQEGARCLQGRIVPRSRLTSDSHCRRNLGLTT